MIRLIQSLRESGWRLLGALVVWAVVGVLAGLPVIALVHQNKQGQLSSTDSTAALSGGQRNRWIHLRTPVDLQTTYTGAAGLTPIMVHRLAQPLSLTSGDFDEDGLPDLISGYVGPAGGILTLHRGNMESLWPKQTSDLRPQISDQINPPSAIGTALLAGGARLCATRSAGLLGRRGFRC